MAQQPDKQEALESLFLTPISAADEPLAAQIERALAERRSARADLPLLTDVAQGDAYLAQQLAALRDTWEIRPPPARGLINRLRTRLAWWLLGAEIQQINTTHATLTRLIDSLVVLVDHERAARRRLEDPHADANHQS